MSETFDKASFPGGYEIEDIIAAVKLAEMMHGGNLPQGETDRVVMQRFMEGLASRHPGASLDDPFQLRAEELMGERRSLLHSHLKFSWFYLAHWVYVLVIFRSRVSLVPPDTLHALLIRVRGALRELGILVSDEECLAEVDRFIPADSTPRSIEAATQMFLSFVRFLHYGALRRREVVTPGLTLPSVGMAFIEDDAEEARLITEFLTMHGVTILQQPAEVAGAARLLVLFSRRAMDSELFWRNVAHWKERDVIPMVVCLMPKAELYREPPADWRKDVWSWLAASVAVELSSDNVDRYLTLLRALDPVDPKQWWWNKADASELALAVDILGFGIPRLPPQRNASNPTGQPYPFAFDETLAAACLVASDRLTQGESSEADARYYAICEDLLKLRQKPNGDPYALPWFVLVYRAWLSFAGRFQAERELQAALFALGIGTDAAEIPAFLENFANLPWATPPSTATAVDERTIAFMVLVHHLTYAAVTRTQRVRLRHPFSTSFISYARPDEGFARELVAALEAKGADVWWDLNAITLGAPLNASLDSAVGDSKFLLLIATPAAEQSPYVRREVETAIREKLRVIPISPEGPIPAGLQSLLDSGRDAIEPILSAVDSDHAKIAASILARLERSPTEQLRWLQSRPHYENLRQQIAKMRASLA